MKTTTLPLLAALTGAALAVPATAQATLTDLSGHGTPIGLSADGKLAAFSDWQNNQAVLWDAVNGFVPVAVGASEITGLARGGDYLVGTVNDQISGNRFAARWESAGGWEILWAPLGAVGCGSSYSEGMCISHDGKVVGMQYLQNCSERLGASWWEDLGGAHLTHNPPPPSPDAMPLSVSGDGRIMGGWRATPVGFTRQAAVWFVVDELLLDPGQQGEVLALNHDGTVAVGTSRKDAFYWSLTGGTQFLGLSSASPWPNESAEATAVSDDGRTIVGQHGFNPFGGFNAAFHWTADDGVRKLNDVLDDHGVAFNGGEDVWEAYAISSDGNSILFGVVPLGGGLETWHVELPSPGPLLRTDTDSISVLAGGAQTMTLDAGLQNAGNLYLLVGSSTGPYPGLDVAGLHVPLNWDAYSNFTFEFANRAIANSFNFLDGNGHSVAQFSLLPNTDPSLAGIDLWHAYSVADVNNDYAPVGVSNPTLLRTTP
jgi:uncharacterized membrane protein